MQEKFQTISDYLWRTNALAGRMGLNLSELPERLGISKAMFFAYRAGKNRITPKAWMKLEAAERDAGISPGDGVMDRTAIFNENPGEYLTPQSMERRMMSMEHEILKTRMAMENLMHMIQDRWEKERK